MFRKFMLWRSLYALLLILSVSQVSGEASEFRYPLSCAGIGIGSTKDAEVTRIYGPGLFVKSEDHGGSRYYVDIKRQVTLHVGIGNDEIIDFIEYQKGVHIPQNSVTRLRTATTPNLTLTHKLGTIIGLGIEFARVLQTLGKPSREIDGQSSKTIHYKTTYLRRGEVISYQSTFRFRRNRLVYLSIYNGDLQ